MYSLALFLLSQTCDGGYGRDGLDQSKATRDGRIHEASVGRLREGEDLGQRQKVVMVVQIGGDQPPLDLNPLPLQDGG